MSRGAGVDAAALKFQPSAKTCSDEPVEVWIASAKDNDAWDNDDDDDEIFPEVLDDVVFAGFGRSSTASDVGTVTLKTCEPSGSPPWMHPEPLTTPCVHIRGSAPS